MTHHLVVDHEVAAVFAEVAKAQQIARRAPYEPISFERSFSAVMVRGHSSSQRVNIATSKLVMTPRGIEADWAELAVVVADADGTNPRSARLIITTTEPIVAQVTFGDAS